jgi:hypothetical protein
MVSIFATVLTAMEQPAMLPAENLLREDIQFFSNISLILLFDNWFVKQLEKQI